MRFLTVGFVICQITVQPQAEKFGHHFPQRIREHEPPEPRFRSSHPDRDYSNYNEGITRKEYHHPDTFKAPPYERQEYWRNNQDYSDRRTFFDDFPPSTPEKALPGLYQFMRSIFHGRDEVTSEHPQTFHYDRATPPYKFVTPYGFAPTEPNYIPPPKPIRASVIKLETITRSPIYPPPFEYETTSKYYPHVKTILNQVLIENSKAQQNQSWYVQEPNVELPPFKPLPVLPKPEHVPPTTLRPTHAGFFNEHPQNYFEYYNRTDYKYPESVQDQLPHLSLADVRIPYVSEKPIPQIFNTPPTIGYVRDFFPTSEATTKTNVLELIDIRSLNRPGTNLRRDRPSDLRIDRPNDLRIERPNDLRIERPSDPRIERPNDLRIERPNDLRIERPNDLRRDRPSVISVEYPPTTVKSFPGAVEKVKRPTFKYTKKLTAQLDKSPVERVTNLTVLGLSKIEKENVNPYKQVNYVNVRKLINYEMDKLGNTSQAERPDNSSTRPVNFYDELSLDAKILKDTNWDGLTVPDTSTTEVLPEETTTTPTTTTTAAATAITTFQPTRPTETKPHKTAFWEVQSTETPNSSEATTTFTEQTNPQTTEFTFWPSTPETTEPVTTEEVTIIPAVRALRGSGEPVTAEPEKPEVSFPPDRTLFRRRYSRRPKIINFTPYPTAEEIQRKLTNRSSHFLKRQKPNITLAFGNKNVLKNRSNFGKDEVMKFSDEDLRKRRKHEKRRHVHKRLRTSSSERPVQDD